MDVIIVCHTEFGLVKDKDKPRPGDIRNSLADISLAKQKLGYMPEYSLEKGLEVTIRWFSTLRRS